MAGLDEEKKFHDKLQKTLIAERVCPLAFEERAPQVGKIHQDSSHVGLVEEADWE